MKVFCLIALVIMVSSVTIINQDQDESIATPIKDHDSLTFSNNRGLLFTNEEYASFKELAVNASKFFGTSALDNLYYITTQMNSTYGLHFNVFLQTSTQIYSNHRINPVYGELYASFAPGMNPVQPQWSYLVFANRQPLVALSYVYVSSGGLGAGFSSTEVQTIVQAVMSADGVQGQCFCYDSLFNSLVSTIANLANNVICQSVQPTYAYFKVNEDRWLSIRPRNCYYTIWSN